MALVPAIAAGQEALQSALSIDPVLEANANGVIPPGPQRHFIGPAQLSLGANLGATYSDNINGAEFNPESDTFISTGISLGIQWPITGQSQIAIGLGLSYIKYLRVTSNDGLAINPNSALVYTVSAGDVSVSAYDQAAYYREALTQGALANVTTLPRIENTVGLRVGWTPDRWNFDVGYSHNNVIAENAVDNYLDSSSEYFFGRAGWAFAESSGAGIEVSGSLTDYSAQLQPNNQSVSVGPYFEWKPEPWLRLSARGGPTFYHFDSLGATPESDLSSYYIFADVSHQIADFLSHDLSIQRSIQPGLNQGSSYTEQLTVTYGISWTLTQSTTLTGNLNYQDGNQPFFLPIGPGLTLQEKENYTAWSIGPTIAWKATDALTASANYTHSWRDSNIPGRNYTGDAVSVNLTYNF